MSDLRFELNKMRLEESIEIMKEKLDDLANNLATNEVADERLEQTLVLIKDLKDKYSSFLVEVSAL